MGIDPEPRIVSAERFDSGIMIGFDNGLTALYSTELLYSIFPLAVEMVDSIAVQDPEND